MRVLLRSRNSWPPETVGLVVTPEEGGRTSEWMRARRGAIYDLAAPDRHIELTAAMVRAALHARVSAG